jgi:hypothetical protein
MKSVPRASAGQALLVPHGLKTLDPYGFEPAVTDALVDPLRQGQDGARPAAPEPMQRTRTARQTRLRQWLFVATALVAAGAAGAAVILLR